MQVFSSLIILFLILVTMAAIGFGIYFWYKSRRYTRERFAFAAFFAITSIITNVAIAIFTPFWVNLLTFAAQVLDSEYTLKQPTALEYVLFIVVFGLFIHFIKHIYDNWSGATSIKQHKRAQRQEPSSIIIDGYDELIRIAKRLPAPEIYNPDDNNSIEDILKGSKDTLVWHQQVIELIMLRSKSYFFDQDEGWHDQQRCWIGRQKRTGDNVWKAIQNHAP